MSNMYDAAALLGRDRHCGTRAVHERTVPSTPDNKYATAIPLTIEPFSGKCCYVNADTPRPGRPR
jgi:hypothetical protein